MYERSFPYGKLLIDLQAGCIRSLTYRGMEFVSGEAPLFQIGLRMPGGELIRLSASDASAAYAEGDRLAFGGFPEQLTVSVSIGGEAAEWRIDVQNDSPGMIEWIDFPQVVLKPLAPGGPQMLYPYNEGALVDDQSLRESSFPYREPEYPSLGAYSVFPNMICSQFMAYLMNGSGLYMGAEDPERGVKAVDFKPHPLGVVPHFRLYCGVGYGDDYRCPFAVRWAFFDGGWQQAAALYRTWFENHLPAGLTACELPAWYHEPLLVVTYPVRGVHDMDEMSPNAFFPYVNALPMLDEIAEKTGSRLLVLLMHWEGTAPWAPPYVWPPYGGEDAFNAFADALHERGHLLGVYCSGFGFTEQSNLIAEYHKKERLKDETVWKGFCAGPDGHILHSRICTGQRSGYDLCAASETGQAILNEAYLPLLQSKVDYVQILDQNHGGGQYFCYSCEHGHAPGPGPWMTTSMQKLLTGWQQMGGGKLLGCESAAAEAFLSQLRFSDNRFELNYHLGKPVPLYAYLYHEYLHNFMGNQVACGLKNAVDTMCLRMAYSFTAGDAMTLSLRPDGELYPSWGCHDFSLFPNKENALTLARNLTRLFKEDAGEWLASGRMIPTPAHSVAMLTVPRSNGTPCELPAVFAAAYEKDGQRVLIAVNHTAETQTIRMDEQVHSISPFDGMLLPL